MAKKSEYVTFRTDEQTKAYLEKRAKNEDRTISWIINKILIEHINREGGEKMTTAEAIAKFREEMHSIINESEFQGFISFKDKDAVLNAIDETEEELLKEVQP